MTPTNFPRAVTVRRMANDVTYTMYAALPIHYVYIQSMPQPCIAVLIRAPFSLQLTGTVSHVLGQATFDTSFQEEREIVQVSHTHTHTHTHTRTHTRTHSHTHTHTHSHTHTHTHTPHFLVYKSSGIIGTPPPSPQEQCQTSGDHLKAGIMGLSSGVFGGMTSIFTQPYRGAVESGVGVSQWGN